MSEPVDASSLAGRLRFQWDTYTTPNPRMAELVDQVYADPDKGLHLTYLDCTELAPDAADPIKAVAAALYRAGRAAKRPISIHAALDGEWIEVYTRATYQAARAAAKEQS